MSTHSKAGWELTSVLPLRRAKSHRVKKNPQSTSNNTGTMHSCVLSNIDRTAFKWLGQFLHSRATNLHSPLRGNITDVHLQQNRTVSYGKHSVLQWFRKQYCFKCKWGIHKVPWKETESKIISLLLARISDMSPYPTSGSQVRNHTSRHFRISLKEVWAIRLYSQRKESYSY